MEIALIVILLIVLACLLTLAFLKAKQQSNLNKIIEDRNLLQQEYYTLQIRKLRTDINKEKGGEN